MCAVDYTIEKIAPLPECDVTVPTGLNNQGQVCGYCYKHVPPGHGNSIFSHPFFWWEGSMARLRTFGGQWGKALGINKRGDVVGYADYERRTGLEEHDRDADYWPALWVAYDERWGPDEAPLPLSQSHGLAVSLNDNREILGQTPNQFWSMIRGKLTAGARPTPPLQEKEKEELPQVALNRHRDRLHPPNHGLGQWNDGVWAREALGLPRSQVEPPASHRTPR